MVTMLRLAERPPCRPQCSVRSRRTSVVLPDPQKLRYVDGMPDDDASRYAAIRDALGAAAASPEPAQALPHLRAAADRLTDLIDDTMARALVTGRTSLRSVGAGAGLSENAVGPRLARTAMLAPYANDNGRVTASGVERARYDHETGRTPEPGPDHTDQEPRLPMRFRPRRTP
jgi:hypothetical protein